MRTVTPVGGSTVWPQHPESVVYPVIEPTPPLHPGEYVIVHGQRCIVRGVERRGRHHDPAGQEVELIVEVAPDEHAGLPKLYADHTDLAHDPS